MLTDIIKIIAGLAPVEFLSVSKFFSLYAKKHLLKSIPFQGIVESGKADLVIYAVEYYKMYRHQPHMFALDKCKHFHKIIHMPVRSTYLRIDLDFMTYSLGNAALIPLYNHYLECIQEYSIMYNANTGEYTDIFTLNDARWDSSKKMIFWRIIQLPELATTIVNSSNIEDILNKINLSVKYTGFLEYCLINIPEIFNYCLNIYSVHIFDLLDKYGYDFTLCDSSHYNDFPGLFDDDPDLLVKFLKWERNGKKWYPNKNYPPSNAVIYLMNIFRPDIDMNYFHEV